MIKKMMELKEEQLLNAVGECLLEYVSKHPESSTSYDLEIWIEEGGDLPTSSLTGCDHELAISEFVSEDDMEAFMMIYENYMA